MSWCLQCVPALRCLFHKKGIRCHSLSSSATPVNQISLSAWVSWSCASIVRGSCVFGATLQGPLVVVLTIGSFGIYLGLLVWALFSHSHGGGCPCNMQYNRILFHSSILTTRFLIFQTAWAASLVSKEWGLLCWSPLVQIIIQCRHLAQSVEGHTWIGSRHGCARGHH